MKWILLTSCLCSASLLALVRAQPTRRSPNPSGTAIHHEHNDELGDVVLTLQQKQALDKLQQGDQKRAAVSKSVINRWTEGIVLYEMVSKIRGTKYEKSFKKAIATWEKYTCVKFVELNDSRVQPVQKIDSSVQPSTVQECHRVNLINSTNSAKLTDPIICTYVTLTSSAICESYIGMVPFNYEVRLGPECHSPGNAMHELGHVLGFFHEHQRPDRDDYITVDEDAIQDNSRAREAYKTRATYEVDSLGVEYDYASIMHYSQRAYAKGDKKAFTVDKKLPECLPEVGQRISISRKDIEQVNRLYKCLDKKVLENLDDCDLLNPSEVRMKKIKTGNVISLGLDEDETTWMSCRVGSCRKEECEASYKKKRNTFTTLRDICHDHQFTLHTAITRTRSDKVKIGDKITLEWKPDRFLDCSHMSGACNMTMCYRIDEEGSSGSGECINHIFRITSDTKEVGDIVQTYDEIHLEYIQNGHYLDCSGIRCMVKQHNGCMAASMTNHDEDQDQIHCKPPSFFIRK